MAVLIGPLFCLLVAGAFASLTTYFALFDRLPTYRTKLNAAAREMQNSPMYCFLVGVASSMLIALLAIFLVRHHPQGWIGVTLLALAGAWFASGAVVASQVVGKRIIGAAASELRAQSAVIVGFLTLSSMTVVPLFGWLLAAIPTLIGAGAIIKAVLTKSSR